MFAFVVGVRDLFVWHSFYFCLFLGFSELVLCKVFLVVFFLWFVVVFFVDCCRMAKSKATEKFIESVNFD